MKNRATATSEEQRSPTRLASGVQRATWARRRRMGSSVTSLIESAAWYGWRGTATTVTRRTGVLVVTLDRPERRNAVDHATLLGLLDAQRGGGRGARRRADRRAAGVQRRRRPHRRRGGRVRRRCSAGCCAASASCRSRRSPPSTVRRSEPARSWPSPATCGWRRRAAASASPPRALGLVVDHWTVERIARELGWPIARAMLVAAEQYDATALHAAGAVHRLGDLDDAAGVGPRARARLAPLTMAGAQAGARALRPAAGDRRGGRGGPPGGVGERRRRRGPPGVPREAPGPLHRATDGPVGSDGAPASVDGLGWKRTDRAGRGLTRVVRPPRPDRTRETTCPARISEARRVAAVGSTRPPTTRRHMTRDAPHPHSNQPMNQRTMKVLGALAALTTLGLTACGGAADAEGRRSRQADPRPSSRRSRRPSVRRTPTTEATQPPTTAAPTTALPTATEAPTAPEPAARGRPGAGRADVRRRNVIDGDTLSTWMSGCASPGSTPPRAVTAALTRPPATRGPPLTLGHAEACSNTPSDDGMHAVDQYGRLLRYVVVDGVDAGGTLLMLGQAVPRYNSTDGYGRHPRGRTRTPPSPSRRSVSRLGPAPAPAPVPRSGPASLPPAPRHPAPALGPPALVRPDVPELRRRACGWRGADLRRRPRLPVEVRPDNDGDRLRVTV